MDFFGRQNASKKQSDDKRQAVHKRKIAHRRQRAFRLETQGLMGEDKSLQGNTAWRNETKRFLEESTRLQKEVADLQEAMHRALEGQEPAVLENPDYLQVPEGSHISHHSQTGMLLLKVRVFLKTILELKKNSITYGKQIDELREMLRARHSDRAVTERLQSLAVSRTLLLQLEAEAGAAPEAGTHRGTAGPVVIIS